MFVDRKGFRALSLQANFLSTMTHASLDMQGHSVQYTKSGRVILLALFFVTKKIAPRGPPRMEPCVLGSLQMQSPKHCLPYSLQLKRRQIKRRRKEIHI